MPLQISATNWEPDHVRFQVWLALPSSERVPKTQKELAKVIGVDEATLWRWKQLPGWNDAVYELGAAQIVGELVPILHAQVVEAKAGSLPHAQWLFEIAVTHSIVTEIETILPPPKIETIE